MRVVIAPDSFKECLPAHQVCEAIAQGVRRVAPDCEILQVPMADGGQGTVEALIRATGGEIKTVQVTGPLGEPVDASFGLLGADATQAQASRTTVLEMASASGLELVPRDRRDPLQATTYGVGELMLAAIESGSRRLLIGIGGSATNDGGAGMAQALGYRLLDEQGNDIGRGGGSLNQLARIDAAQRDPRLGELTIEVACDVTNPLTGPRGASAVYGPQKGATPAMIEQLDQNLVRLAAIVRRDLGIEMESIPGSGAAGGLGGGLLAFAGARLRRGIELVIDAVQLRDKLRGADLCLTGEGAIDHSSQFGKTAVGVASVCRELSIPAIALGGAIGPGARAVLDHGVTAYFDITQRPCSLEDAIRAAADSLADTAEQVMRLFLARK